MIKNSNGMNLESVTIFTDGSSRGNPGPGGFGAIVIVPKNHESEVKNHEVREIGGREEHTTNNRMELTAAIQALKFIQNQGSTLNRKKGRTLVLYSDSSYVINGITKWVFGWQKNGWKTMAKKEVENRDSWEELLEQTRNKKIEWKLIGGHVGVRGNERCDQIATAFADGEIPELYSGNLPNYRIRNILDVGENVSARAKKSKSSTRSKAKAYSYLSQVDGVTVRHTNWADCEKRVKGKSGVRFKKALSKEEETEIMNEWKHYETKSRI